MTTVREMISELQTLPPDATVILSKDAEGNDYSTYEDATTGCYVPNSTWAGEFTEDPDDDDWPDDAVEAVCLWPTN